MTKAQRSDASAVEERKFLGDQYRATTFKLLQAARSLRATTNDLLQVKSKVSGTALVDLAEARAIVDALTETWTILAELPEVPVAAGSKWSKL